MSVDETVTQPRGGAAATLDLFKQARDQVIQILTEGREQAHVLGSLQEQLEDDFQAASKAVEASCLSLVVVGGEGTGKSTLINTITGADVTPRERQVPGTVAPCFLLWGPKADPVYSVITADSEGEKPCRDHAEFGEYILQKHNENNHKGVKLGYIRWDHPVLQRGLMLVDMPGVEGVSPGIRAQAEEFIKKHAQAVIGIVRDRNYGPLVRIAHTFSHKDMTMQAIVSNWNLDIWVDPYPEIQSDVEAEVERFIPSQRKITLEQLEKEGGGIVAGEDNVYVLHLPSACNIAAGKTPMVTWPAHERERARFEKDFWKYVEENGVKEVILEASRRAEQALLELDVLLGTRQRVLDGVLGGDEKAGAALADTFRKGRALADATWTKAYNDEVIDRVAHQHWEPFKAAVEGVRNRIVDKIRELETSVEAHEGRIRKPEAQAIWTNLTDYITTEQGVVGDTQDKILDEVDDYYCQFANAALNELFEAVPLVRDTVPDEFKVSRQGLEDFVLKGLDEDTMDRMIKGGAALAGGVVGAKIATGILATSLAAPLVFFAAPVIAWKLADLIRDGQRPALLKGLANAREQIMGMDTSDSGELRIAWGASVKGVADAVNAYLGERISRLEAMIADPGADTGELEAQRGEVEKARGAVKDLQNRLNIIASFSK